MENTNKRIEVDTVFGKLIAEVGGDPYYPGISIFLAGKDGDEDFEKDLAMVEATPDTPKDNTYSLRVLVYNSDEEGFTDEFTIMEQDAEEQDFTENQESEEVKWKKYCQYLKDWADSHADAGFLGCTPACYDEWLHGEYLNLQYRC